VQIVSGIAKCVAFIFTDVNYDDSFEWADESAVAIQDQPQRQQRKPLSAASTNWQADGGQSAGAGACYSVSLLVSQ
jgi:hypothetical protein